MDTPLFRLVYNVINVIGTKWVVEAGRAVMGLPRRWVAAAALPLVWSHRHSGKMERPLAHFSPCPPGGELAALLEPRSHDRESAKCSVPGGFGCGALEGAHRAGKFRGGLVVAVRVASRLPEPGHEVPAECQCPTAAHSELTTRCPRPEHRWPRPATRWRCPRQDRGRHLDGHGHRRDWRGSPEEVR